MPKAGDDDTLSPGRDFATGVYDERLQMIDVLDHGFVRLVDHMGDDVSVARAARVSYDAAWRAGEDAGSDAKLIRYLWANRHTTPFEAVTFTFEAKAPIFVVRQWHRHRTWSYNEVSARYKELPEEFYTPAPESIGVQSASSKQARDIVEIDWSRKRAVEGQIASYRSAIEQSFASYRDRLANGWPRELARAVLPVATYTHMFATVNLLNLFRFLSLRIHPHAQHEIRVYAEAMRELVRPVVPVCLGAWEESSSS